MAIKVNTTAAAFMSCWPCMSQSMLPSNWPESTHTVHSVSFILPSYNNKKRDAPHVAVVCRGASTGTIKALPASVRQPPGFRTIYSSMHASKVHQEEK